jgi:hypothetical protein
MPRIALRQVLFCLVLGCSGTSPDAPTADADTLPDAMKGSSIMAQDSISDFCTRSDTMLI